MSITLIEGADATIWQRNLHRLCRNMCVCVCVHLFEIFAGLFFHNIQCRLSTDESQKPTNQCNYMNITNLIASNAIFPSSDTILSYHNRQQQYRPYRWLWWNYFHFRSSLWFSRPSVNCFVAFWTLFFVCYSNNT